MNSACINQNYHLVEAAVMKLNMSHKTRMESGCTLDILHRPASDQSAHHGLGATPSVVLSPYQEATNTPPQ